MPDKEENIQVLLIEEQDNVPHIKTGYEWLQEMILVRDFQSSYKAKASPLTNRASFIIESLNKIGLAGKYQLDIFDETGFELLDYNRPKLMNIIVRFDSPHTELPAVVISSHFDIANPNSQNCQDNSCSVCNLLHLSGILLDKIQKGEQLPRPVIILFNDREEFGGTGIQRFADKCNEGAYGLIGEILVLELTGLGDTLWHDSENGKWLGRSITGPLAQKLEEVMGGVENCKSVGTPFSDNYVLRRKGFNSLCIGILPAIQLLGKNRKETWSLCHSPEDTIEKVSEQDMTNFVDILERFILQ